MTAGGRRERALRTATFWLRPAFALRVLGRFQRIVGFDRSMALASSALTAIVPLTVLIGVALGGLWDHDAAERIIDRYGLKGEGAAAVRAALPTTTGENGAGFGVFGAVFLMISMLSFARAAQRLFEQTWELRPLSVRNSRNGLGWLLSLGAYTTVSGWLYTVLGGDGPGLVAAAVEVPLTAVFLLWSGRLLSAKRLTVRDLLPFGIAAAVLSGAYSVAATVYLPRLFDSYVGRYGTVGAVFAMISALFGAMLVMVGSAALGREIRDELDRIGAGLRPSEDEVRREWSAFVERTRSHWSRRRTSRQRSGRRPPEPPEAPEPPAPR
ncbi:YhjD/YihY/BrkB family envelope integrity protein [Streptomyces sp. NPDC047000]|uniref:YhjD/YihY/BrkB family envelope integrity protein n=1 Tax=Streptomyces sp. NPDC047000 TaxID=3155474 RepID=UPI0033EB1F7E